MYAFKPSRVAAVLRMLPLLSFASLAHAAGASPLGSTWADAGKMPDLFSGMWMTFSGFVEGDAQLNVPYTAKAQKYVAAYKPKRDIPYAQEGCRSPGLPIAMRMGGGIKFTYAPGLLSIYMQSLGHTRFIWMNQKQGRTSPKFYGNSVGHWEGETLVVESEDFLPEITFQYGVGKPLPPLETVGTANLGPPPGSAPPGGGAPGGGPPPSLASLSAAIWGPHGEGMRMVERMRLVDPNTLEVNLEIYDDTVWTKPYVTTRNYRRFQKGNSEKGQFTGEPEEWVCTVSITTFDPDTNTYVDKDPEAMVKMLDSRGK
ncbi:MAG: hypothetical protein JWL65_4718 [Gammaproteobacteria bacterium]|nr:hypothetical protein [Gammaproteobacteria bacterium]